VATALLQVNEPRITATPIQATQLLAEPRITATPIQATQLLASQQAFKFYFLIWSINGIGLGIPLHDVPSSKLENTSSLSIFFYFILIWKRLYKHLKFVTS
jgi:hypothetical protein